MAHIYVDSAAAGAGTGADWANAYTTLEAAAEAAGTAAGDSIWIAHTHAETSGAAVTITFKNTAAAPGTVMCVNKAGTVPPVSADLLTTAVIETTGNSNLSLVGWAYIYGITFSAGTGAVAADLFIVAGTSHLYFKNCALKRLGTSAGQIQTGTGTPQSRVTLDNTTLTFGAVGDSLTSASTNLVWKNTSSALGGAVFPTTLVINAGGNIVVEGVDLSALGVGKTVFGSTLDVSGNALFKNCKLGASVTKSAAPAGSMRPRVTFINCDSGDTNYQTDRYAYEGTQSIETTAVLTDGASDGTTPISWKIETTANSELIAPFESLPISIWNETVGSVTVTVQGTWDQVAVPTNAQIWMEVEYLGVAGFPQSVFASTGLADVLATPANLAAGDGEWAAPADVYTKFKMTKAITTTKKGPISVRVYAAAASFIFYIDPRIVLS